MRRQQRRQRVPHRIVPGGRRHQGILLVAVDLVVLDVPAETGVAARMAKAEIGGEPKEGDGRGTAELEFLGAVESGATSLRPGLGGLEPLLAGPSDTGEQLP